MRKLQLLFMLLLFSSGALFAQTRVLTGTVRDSSGNTPLAYVTVKVKGQNINATTGTDGAFSINLPSAGAVLEVSYVGYETQTIDVSGEQTNLLILLGRSQAVLGEVVVTALGISKDARKVGYAITTVNGDVMNKARETNVALSLEGRVAGLSVHGTNGGPGGTARILLRGMPSINSSGAPLFVINGVPMDNTQRGSTNEWGGADLGDGIGNLNPDDIETMTVLKGQSASALYGARASNGVILITTKSGKKGTFSIDYNTNYTLEKVIDYTDFQYEYGQGEQGLKPTAATARNTTRLSWGTKLDGTPVPAFDGNSYAYSAVKDNMSNFYRTAPSFTNTIAVSSGTDRGNFRLSVSDLDGNSTVRNSGVYRKSFNLNMEQKVTDKLKVSVLANYIDEFSKNRPQLSDGPMNPNNGIFLATNVDENILKPGFDPITGHEIQFSDDEYVTNPWFVVNQFVNNLNRKRLISAVTGRYSFNNWIYAQARVGYDLINDRVFHVTPWGTAYTTGEAFKGQLDELSQTQRSELNVDGLLGASHKLSTDINLDVALGANLRKSRYEETGVSGGPFVLPYLYSFTNVVNYGRSYGYSLKEVHSAYYTVDLTYKNFLTLNTTGRYDTYSTLPNSNRDLFTPSVSASFVFSELAHINKLNYGKLRASYAQTSGEPNNPYQTTQYYGVGNALNGTPTGNYGGGLPNYFLKPFTLDEFEIGAELKFLNNRLGFDIAYFNRTTHNEIQSAGLSQTTGYTSTLVGTGSTLNKGLEVMVTGTPIQTKNFAWNISLNATNVANKILETDKSGSNISLGTDRFNHGAVNTAFIKGMSGPQILVHDYKYDAKGNIVVDASGLPVAGNLVTAGNVLPTLYGGLNNEFTYKNLNLSFLLDFNYGNKILSSTKAEAIYRGLDKSTLVGREGGVKVGVQEDGSANTIAANAQTYYQKLSQNVQIQDVLNGDYIKLRQITLGYTISERAFAHVPLLRSLQISLVARNLLTLVKHSDNIDPEATFGAVINYVGIEGTALPSTRTFGINANFKFK